MHSATGEPAEYASSMAPPGESAALAPPLEDIPVRTSTLAYGLQAQRRSSGCGLPSTSAHRHSGGRSMSRDPSAEMVVNFPSTDAASKSHKAPSGPASGDLSEPLHQPETPDSEARKANTSASSIGTRHRNPQKRTSIGPWEFAKSIGAGSMGQVKLAYHRYTRQPAAVKVVPKAFIQPRRHGGEADHVRDARVVREAALGRLVDHPNIAKLYDVYSMTGHYYLVFEYVAGGQMLDYIIAHGSVKEHQARRFARSIASALDYCHRNSIVHRDLKIENILIADDGDVRLIDFGLSNLFYRDSLLKTFCGSLYFAAPELLNALPYVGPEIDVWSFGVVLYVLVCGKVPFEDKSMSVLHAKIKRGVVEYPTWLSSLCVDLLSRMLVVSPSERATLHEVMHHPWINKNFDGPPAVHMPTRVPLQLPLDPLVIREMADLKLGTEEELTTDLELLLQSAPYQEAVAAWYARGQSQSSVTLPLRIPDPLDSYHPTISIYFLARERLEKRRRSSSDMRTTASVVATSTPSGLAITSPTMPPVPPVLQISQAVQPLSSVPPSPNAAPPWKAAGGRARASTVGTVSEPPLLDVRRAESLRRRSVAASGAGLPNTVPELPEIPAQAMQPSESQSRPTGISDMRTPSTPSSARSPPPTPYFPQTALGSAEKDQSLGSLLRRISIRRPKSQAKNPGHARAKSTGYTQLHDIPLDNSGASQQSDTSSALSGPREAMPSIESPKPVFLRGFFSVQSTSTRPLVEIRADIIRTLTKLGAEFVEIRGGFSCVYRPQPTEPSTPLLGGGSTSTMTPATTLGSPVPPGTPTRSSSLNRNSSRSRPSSSRARSTSRGHMRQPSSGLPGIGAVAASGSGFSAGSGSGGSQGASSIHRRVSSRGGGSSNTQWLVPPGSPPPGSHSSSDSVDIVGSDMLGAEVTTSHAPVRFEIMIVRVPIVSLHGVQFKKLSGNVWQYKTLAQTILAELRL